MVPFMTMLVVNFIKYGIVLFNSIHHLAVFTNGQNGGFQRVAPINQKILLIVLEENYMKRHEYLKIITTF